MTETERLNAITGDIVDAAYGIHNKLGPGLVENVYEALLERELKQRGHYVERQKPIRFKFEGVTFDEAFRADLLIDRAVIVEVKSAEKLAYVFERQLLTYLRILDYRVGLLINFGGPVIKDGIRRLVNKL